MMLVFTTPEAAIICDYVVHMVLYRNVQGEVSVINLNKIED